MLLSVCTYIRFKYPEENQLFLKQGFLVRNFWTTFQRNKCYYIHLRKSALFKYCCEAISQHMLLDILK